MRNLTHDKWWEVQAQLLLLASRLLLHRCANRDDPNLPEEAEGALVDIIARIFVPNNAKNVLQVGLVNLPFILQIPEYKDKFMNVYVQVLMNQPAPLRTRLITAPADSQQEGSGTATSMRCGLTVSKIGYVMGSDARHYEEHCVKMHWQPLEMASAFTAVVEQASLDNFDHEHISVFEAILGEVDNLRTNDVNKWSMIFDKLAPYILLALIDPDFHQKVASFLHKFWSAGLGMNQSTVSVFLQTLRLLNTPTLERSKVEEDNVTVFLRQVASYNPDFNKLLNKSGLAINSFQAIFSI